MEYFSTWKVVEKGLGFEKPIGKFGKETPKKVQKATSLLSLLKAREVSLKDVEYTINTCFLLETALTIKKKVWQWHLWGFKSNYLNGLAEPWSLELLKLWK